MWLCRQVPKVYAHKLPGDVRNITSTFGSTRAQINQCSYNSASGYVSLEGERPYLGLSEVSATMLLLIKLFCYSNNPLVSHGPLYIGVNTLDVSVNLGDNLY